MTNISECLPLLAIPPGVEAHPVGVKIAVLRMRRSTARIDVMQSLPVVFGLGEIAAATAIGISASKFRTLVGEKRMPSPSITVAFSFDF